MIEELVWQAVSESLRTPYVFIEQHSQRRIDACQPGATELDDL